MRFYDLEKIGTAHTTTSGKGANAAPADVANGTADTHLKGETNRWLHPLQLRIMLEYARDLFLGGRRSDLEAFLPAYEAALSQPKPDDGVWHDAMGSHWTSAASDIAVMLQRLRGHLDFFGNGAGYTPFLSLRSTIKLYKNELDRALSMLLLVHWMTQTEQSTKERADILGESIGKLNVDMTEVAEKIMGLEAKISEYRGQMRALKIFRSLSWTFTKTAKRHDKKSPTGSAPSRGGSRSTFIVCPRITRTDTNGQDPMGGPRQVF